MPPYTTTFTSTNTGEISVKSGNHQGRDEKLILENPATVLKSMHSQLSIPESKATSIAGGAQVCHLCDCWSRGWGWVGCVGSCFWVCQMVGWNLWITQVVLELSCYVMIAGCCLWFMIFCDLFRQVPIHGSFPALRRPLDLPGLANIYFLLIKSHLNHWGWTTAATSEHQTPFQTLTTRSYFLSGWDGCWMTLDPVVGWGSWSCMDRGAKISDLATRWWGSPVFFCAVFRIFPGIHSTR